MKNIILLILSQVNQLGTCRTHRAMTRRACRVVNRTERTITRRARSNGFKVVSRWAVTRTLSWVVSWAVSWDSLAQSFAGRTISWTCKTVASRGLRRTLRAGISWAISRAVLNSSVRRRACCILTHGGLASSNGTADLFL